MMAEYTQEGLNKKAKLLEAYPIFIGIMHYAEFKKSRYPIDDDHCTAAFRTDSNKLTGKSESMTT